SLETPALEEGEHRRERKSFMKKRGQERKNDGRSIFKIQLNRFESTCLRRVP
ncbi:hypothetical protein NPIL_160751, partial [Nephila pilipes]